MSPPSASPSPSEPPTAHSRSRSYAWAWLLAVLAVPLLYVVSWPWVSIYVADRAADSNPAYRFCSEPWVWLTTKSPVLKPLSEYQMWCWEVVHPGSILKDE